MKPIDTNIVVLQTESVKPIKENVSSTNKEISKITQQVVRDIALLPHLPNNIPSFSKRKYCTICSGICSEEVVHEYNKNGYDLLRLTCKSCNYIEEGYE